MTVQAQNPIHDSKYVKVDPVRRKIRGFKVGTLVAIPHACELMVERPLSSPQVCVGIWFYSLALVIPPYMGWSNYVPEAFLASCTWDFYTRTLSNRTHYVFLLFFGFLVPVSIIFWAYLSIVRRFRLVREARKRMEFWVAKIVFVLIVLFLVSCTPYKIFNCIAIFGDIELITPWVSAALEVFAKASVVYNPIVFGISHPAFRYNLKRRLVKILSANMNEDEKEAFQQSSSSDASRLQRGNGRRLSRDSSSANTNRILTRFRDYHREASSGGDDSIVSCLKDKRNPNPNPNHKERTVRFLTPEPQLSDGGSSREIDGKNNRVKVKGSSMDGSNYILLDRKENGEAIIRISKRKRPGERNCTPGVSVKNQLLQMLLSVLQKNEDPAAEKDLEYSSFHLCTDEDRLDRIDPTRGSCDSVGNPVSGRLRVNASRETFGLGPWVSLSVRVSGRVRAMIRIGLIRFGIVGP
ncbi:unnamed protein product [Darwinula stevensoni]|uniref:G-protein coupled receptors family 1 profile domain-containing protein n=1 Tax=Darwinula stevensoni TaxID=69355 RepID=A0A7R8XEL6_9CRUS|nr:unnamed protein product [Darwinula stevensoni]CAG0894134.1 unnamed protein product [Darwinula stevensoni]